MEDEIAEIEVLLRKANEGLMASPPDRDSAMALLQEASDRLEELVSEEAEARVKLN